MQCINVFIDIIGRELFNRFLIFCFVVVKLYLTNLIFFVVALADDDDDNDNDHNQPRSLLTTWQWGRRRWWWSREKWVPICLMERAQGRPVRRRWQQQFFQPERRCSRRQQQQLKNTKITPCNSHNTTMTNGTTFTTHNKEEDNNQPLWQPQSSAMGTRTWFSARNKGGRSTVAFLRDMPGDRRSIFARGKISYFATPVTF